MEQNNETKKEKTVALIVLILIILFLMFFILIQYIGKIDNNKKIPTGNVDIFDIVFGDASLNNHYCNCECDCHKPNNENTICNNCQNSNNSETVETMSPVVVYDDENTYSVSTPLRIFTHTSYYVLNGVIAPESENTYQFVVRNNNNFSIKYNLEMLEENIYNINMKFRLKINGIYVAGNDEQYITIEELSQYNMILADNNYDVYTLDWKWFESDNDTQIGTNVNSNYKLSLKMSATQF